MQKKDKQNTDTAEMEAILKEAQVCRIALTDGRQPYLVPLCFGYEPGSLYIHSAPEGKKIDMIRANPRVCFEVDSCNGIVKGDRPCSWGMRYKSVIGFGSAVILNDPEEKKHGLNCIMHQYHGGTHEFSDADLRNVAVIRIAIGSVTVKKKE
jgi:nitroimidazol reductase NimA-like FMN-containing flavoprotein (pyridoxamine 5'-phosphate oxidase superfamily)